MPEYWPKFALDEIDASSYRLSKWEEAFLDSIRDRVETGFALTPRQEDALLNIHRKATELRGGFFR